MATAISLTRFGLEPLLRLFQVTTTSFDGGEASGSTSLALLWALFMSVLALSSRRLSSVTLWYTALAVCVLE